ncbi:Gldg family protein [Anaerolineales bacterium]
MNKKFILTRYHIGRIAVGIGAIAILIAVLTAIASTAIDTTQIILLLIGAIGLGIWVWALPHEIKGILTGRQTQQGLISFFSSLLVIGIVSLLYILAQQQVYTFDATLDGRFSLAKASDEILDAVKRSPRPIQIIAFYTAEDVLQREIDTQYFRLYETTSNGTIETTYVDPIEQPGFASPFAPGLAQGYNVYLAFLNEDNTIDFTSVLPVVQSGTQERDITRSLAQLLVSGEFKIYFETSLDTLDPLDNTAQGMSVINEFVRANGIITDPLSLESLAASNTPIPEDASALILARPRRELDEKEMQIIDQYLSRGGSLMILSDINPASGALFMGKDSLFRQYIKQEYGLEPLDAVVIDELARGKSALDVLSFAVYTGNQITENIAIEEEPDSSTEFHIARPILVTPHDRVSNGHAITSSQLSWIETNFTDLVNNDSYAFDPDEDTEGPVTLAAWANSPINKSKIILIGDADFAMNSHSLSPRGNTMLFLNSVGWLSGFSEEVNFEPQTYIVSPLLFVSGPMLDNIALITIVILPGSMLLIALLIWFRRRSTKTVNT